MNCNFNKIITIFLLITFVYVLFYSNEQFQSDNALYNIKDLSEKGNLGPIGPPGPQGPTGKNGSFVNFPKGIIVSWYGKTNIPSGWTICNGTKNTPDLRGRFILGESASKKINTTGGFEKVKLAINQMPKHNHSMSNNGTHSHSGNTNPKGRHRHSTKQYHDNFKHSGAPGEGSTKNGGKGSFNQYSNYEDNHSHAFVTSKGGEHSHIINYSGKTDYHENMPPYYVLIYIMKI